MKFCLIIVVIILALYCFKRKKERLKMFYYNSLYKYKELARKYHLTKKKYLVEFFQMKNFFITIFVTIILFFSIILFLKFSNVIEFNNKNIILSKSFLNSDFSDYCYDYLWAQISSSLIVSTIVSILSIFSTTYVYGKKQINVIFHYKSLLSLGKMYGYLILLIFSSLIICLNDELHHIILINFIITLIIISYMMIKVIFFYTHPIYYIDAIKVDYLKREIKHIKKAKPLDSHSDIEILNLKSRTMELIQKNDNDYCQNINVLMELVGISLKRNPKAIQEYYTEYIDRSDFISTILEIIIHLIKYDKILEASNLMAQLYFQLRFHRVVLVNEHFSYGIILDLINSGKYIENEREALEHYRLLWIIIDFEIYFLYLYENELDLSYCRLSKDNLIYYISHNNFLEKLYLSIKENKHLSSIEKNRIYDQLYDNIRMMEFKEDHPDRDIRQLWNNDINKQTIKIPLVIKGEPIALMLLTMFEEGDISNLIRYKTMNVSKELMNYLISIVTLSLIEFINKDCKRVYVNDLDIEEEQIIEIFIKSKFHNQFHASSNDMKELYNIILDDYINKKESRSYMLMPRMRISIDVLNNYFYHLHKKENLESEFFDLIGNSKFNKDNKILEIISKLKI